MFKIYIYIWSCKLLWHSIIRKNNACRAFDSRYCLAESSFAQVFWLFQELFPANKRSSEYFSKYFSDAGLKELSDFAKNQQSIGARKELQKEIQDQMSHGDPLKDVSPLSFFCFFYTQVFSCSMPLRPALKIAFYLTPACLCLEKRWWNGCSESIKSSWNPLILNNIISSRMPPWEFSCFTILHDWISCKIFFHMLASGVSALSLNVPCRLSHMLGRKWRRTTSRSRQWLDWCGPVWWAL